MIGQIKSVDTVKNKLKVESFDNLTEKQETKLKKMIPKMEKDVALHVMQELPNYIDFCKEFVAGMQDVCKEAIQSSDETRISTIESYQIILRDLEAELDRPDITDRRRDKITTKMLKVAQCISEEGEKHRQFMQKAFSKALAAGGMALTFIGTIAYAIFKRIPPER